MAVERETGVDQDKLAAYARLVRAWAVRVNLVARSDLDDLERRHIADSLILLPLVRELDPGAAIDVGSGAGFPGIPLAIAEPARRWRLLEPRRKRAAFLEEVVRELRLDCEVVIASAEEAVHDVRLAGRHRLATARALAPPGRAFELIAPLVAPGGVAAVFCGPGAKVPPKAAVWRHGILTMAIEGGPDG